MSTREVFVSKSDTQIRSTHNPPNLSFSYCHSENIYTFEIESYQKANGPFCDCSQNKWQQTSIRRKLSKTYW